MRTILFHGPNTVGIGHMNRIASLIRGLGDIEGRIRPVVMIEGESALLDAYQIPYIRMLEDRKLYLTNDWKHWSHVERITVQTHVVRGIIEGLKPDLAVIDCFSTLAFSMSLGALHCPLVVCMREMANLDKYLAAMRPILERAVALIVAHEPKELGLPKPLLDKCQFVGEITQPELQRKIHGKKPAGERTSILITAGGGGAPGTIHFYNTALAASSLLQRCLRDCYVTLVLGPNFSDDSALIVPGGTKVIRFESDMLARMAESDLVLCQAGYNTIAELRQINVRVVCVPAPRPADNQYARALAFQRSTANVRVAEGANADDLFNSMKELMREPIIERHPSPPSGAAQASRILIQLANLHVDSGATFASRACATDDMSRRVENYAGGLEKIYKQDDGDSPNRNRSDEGPLS